MGKRPKKKFFKRRYTIGKQAYEKVLNIIDYQRNTNQNNDTILSKFKWLISKRQAIANAGKAVERREPSYTVGGNIN